MGKVFNTSGDCKPDRHYMVNIQKRLLEIREMVDRGDYFCINRVRQYGKTTTLRALRQLLQEINHENKSTKEQYYRGSDLEEHYKNLDDECLMEKALKEPVQIKMKFEN